MLSCNSSGRSMPPDGSNDGMVSLLYKPPPAHKGCGVRILLGMGVGWLLLCGCTEVILQHNPRTSDAGPDAGAAVIGQPCDPLDVTDVCASSGLVCDSLTQLCRLPSTGEQCQDAVGCSALPVGLGCYSVALSGTPSSVCLIPCSSGDSSSCPYGTSCGDPNLPGYCSAEGT